jgi:tetraacyldisaccharide 4'-kinase
VWHGKSPSARLLRLTLMPLSWLYAAGWQGYLAVYRLGWKRAKEPHRPVICIGNLVAGGSGKSPLTLYIASILEEMGHEIIVGCSGYGAPHSEDATLAPEGPLDAGQWGDEPAMLRWLAPDLPLIVGRDRVRAAEICHAKYPTAVLLMDDGFQHLPLQKHLTILSDPPGANRCCLPAGPYREPWRNRSRADVVLPNGFTPTMKIGDLKSPDGASVSLDTLPKVSVLCALGNPARFLNDLKALGVTVEQCKLLPDHDDLQVGNLFDQFDLDLPLIVTAKDWVKLQRRGDLGSRQLLIAEQEVRIEPEAEFRTWLERKLDELTKEQPAP